MSQVALAEQVHVPGNLYEAKEPRNLAVMYRTLLGIRLSRQQLEAERLLHNGTKVLFIAGGERAGKSFIAATLLGELIFIRARTRKGPGLFWIMGPNYDQTKVEFEYLSEQMQRWGLLIPSQGNPTHREEGKWHMSLVDGTEVRTWSTEDVLKIASRAPDAIAMCEAAQIPHEGFQRALGRLAQTDGPMILAGTFEGSLGWFPELYERLQGPNDLDGAVVTMPSWANRVVFPAGRQDPKILFMENEYGPEKFGERYGAKPCTPSDVVFPQFNMRTHVDAHLHYNPDLPLEIAVDPGWAKDSAYAVAFVQWDDTVPGQERIYYIDEVYEPGSTTTDVIGKCKTRPYWEHVEGGTIDIAALAEVENNQVRRRWRVETGLELRCRLVRIQDGIDRHARLLGNIRNPDGTELLGDDGKPIPHIKIAAKCRNLMAEHGKYRWPKRMETASVKRRPLDRFNHLIKACVYWEIQHFGYVYEAVQKAVWNWPFWAKSPGRLQASARGRE